jgi:hypothetical protein
MDGLLLSAIEYPAGWGIRQKDTDTEPFVPQRSISEVEIAIVKLKSYTSPGAYQIPAEPFQAGGGHYILRSTDLFR